MPSAALLMRMSILPKAPTAVSIARLGDERSVPEAWTPRAEMPGDLRLVITSVAWVLALL